MYCLFSEIAHIYLNLPKKVDIKLQPSLSFFLNKQISTRTACDACDIRMSDYFMMWEQWQLLQNVKNYHYNIVQIVAN